MLRIGLLLLLALLWACEDASVDTTESDLGIAPGSQDALSSDSEFNVDVQPEAVPLDVSPDTAPATPGCEPGQGCFGEPCSSGEDCISLICTMHMGDKVCSKTCESECPDGWDCTLVSSGGDGEYVCTSAFSHLCMPCETAEGCAGDGPNACVVYAQDEGVTSFCGGACDLDTPCPSGYACQEVLTAGGGMSYQCVNTAGSCPCSSLAVASSLATRCEITNQHGTCVGTRTCGETGLSECSVGAPAPEVCNGVDDDCNGLTDELDCDDDNACTADTCEGISGCLYEPLSGDECLDGDPCTVADHCEEGICVGQALNCDDENPCTVDSCDGVGGCVHEPASQLCDDEDPCTLGDVCQEGACVGSAILTCDDKNPCTADSCSDSGCVYEPIEAPCDDANACTTEDACSAGACMGVPVACDDENLCTTDLCDEASGCVNTPNTQPCTDGSVCTVGDMCSEGSCQEGPTALVCDDGNPCTDDSCGPSGCVFTPNTLACDDGNACTTGDVCGSGVCSGAALVCDDENLCTTDACDLNSGCVFLNNSAPCDDGGVSKKRP